MENKKISDFEQLVSIPENDLKQILKDVNPEFLAAASMGASPRINNLLEKLLPNIDFKTEISDIGRIRIEEVEKIQKQIVSMINLYTIDKEI